MPFDDMPLQLYAHPFSSYSQKALISLYENGIAFDYRMLEDSQASQEWQQLWPIKRFPVLVDGGRTLMEASIIIEHLQLHHRGAVSLIPDDADAALKVRLMDRFFDNYIHTPMQKIVLDQLRPEAARDAHGVSEARAMLDTSYAWLDQHLQGRTWASGGQFSLADCAAAPALFYADWAHPIAAQHARVIVYRHRLNARPSSLARSKKRARIARIFRWVRRTATRVSSGVNPSPFSHPESPIMQATVRSGFFNCDPASCRARGLSTMGF